MPLVEVYAREQDFPKTFGATELEAFLLGHFGVERGVVQVMFIPVRELSPEPFYISIRAKGTPERAKRTAELLAGLEGWLTQRGVTRGKVRMELYEPSLQSVRAWAPKQAKL
mmetsp:Transcript_67665/g.195921  ORF Transcript_67665/g.195921 Transcript_67665/m.195921 type:complete len:112 (-) Transcript_67665:87-422(-)